ncbi:MAG: hypothetical protein QNI95_11920 [Desulfobacterales bacterium]|nr:hypothetical protein [Desulfobacterales bacterium]
MFIDEYLKNSNDQFVPLPFWGNAALYWGDNGGRRSGHDRRKSTRPYDGPERRSGHSRRQLFDRRRGLVSLFYPGHERRRIFSFPH